MTIRTLQVYLPASSGVRIWIFCVAMSDPDFEAEESAFPKRNDMMAPLYI